MKILVGIKNFIKWFLDTQIVNSKAPVWRDFFMNAITFIILHVFAIQVLNGQKISNEFMMLLSMVIGFYFNNKSHKTENCSCPKCSKK